MKKILVAAAALVWAGSAFAQTAGTASGTQHHSSPTLSCSECHVMHASRSHSYTGAGTVDARYSQGVGHPKLLVADGTNETCLACHDAPFGDNTDVFKSVTGSLLNLRSGGALNGAVAGHEDNTVYQDWQGHTLGSAAAPPGWDSGANGAWDAGAEGFNCSTCHAVHGGAVNAFRNLGGSPYMGPASVFGSFTSPFLTNYPTIPQNLTPAGTIDTTADVSMYAKADRPAGAGTGSKDARNVIFGVGSANVGSVGPNGMNRYCAVCHGNFHNTGMTDVNGDYLKHPTTGSPDIVARMSDGMTAHLGYTTAQFNVTRPVYTAADRTAGEVGCLTCHKAHGNKRAYGLIWPANGQAEVAGTTNFEDGNGTVYQALCKTCHPMARQAAP